LHLATAYLRAGQLDQARKMYQGFKTGTVDERLITAGERAMVQELEKALTGPAPKN